MAEFQVCFGKFHGLMWCSTLGINCSSHFRWSTRELEVSPQHLFGSYFRGGSVPHHLIVRPRACDINSLCEKMELNLPVLVNPLQVDKIKIYLPRHLLQLMNCSDGNLNNYYRKFFFGKPTRCIMNRKIQKELAD